MADKHTIPVEIEAHGFEEAAEKIELMADAIDSLPAMVNIKAKDCEVNVHTTNIVEKQEPFKTYAPGGVIRPKPNYEPEAEMITRLNPEADQLLETRILTGLKERCERRENCEGCLYHRAEAKNGCRFSGYTPVEWLI